MLSITGPVLEAWHSPELAQALSSFDAFGEMLQLPQVARYLESRGFANTTEWATQPLDDEGQALQQLLMGRVHVGGLLMSRTRTS